MDGRGTVQVIEDLRPESVAVVLAEWMSTASWEFSELTDDAFNDTPFVAFRKVERPYLI